MRSPIARPATDLTPMSETTPATGDGPCGTDLRMRPLDRLSALWALVGAERYD
jgi:hypothetical protein